MSHAIFEDLESAGRQLAGVVETKSDDFPVVLGIANSGVPVAVPIAQKLAAPLDAIIIRRLFVPGGGVLSSCAVNVAGSLVAESASASRSEIEAQFVSNAIGSLSQRSAHIRGSLLPRNLLGKHTLLIDNGIHTGSTIQIAIAAVRRLCPLRITVAVPISNARIKDEVESLADTVICLKWVDNFGHAGLWYQHFNRPSDDQVKTVLAQSIERSS